MDKVRGFVPYRRGWLFLRCGQQEQVTWGLGDVLDVQVVAGTPRPGTLAIPVQAVRKKEHRFR